jgi:hypothetical protein
MSNDKTQWPIVQIGEAVGMAMALEAEDFIMSRGLPMFCIQDTVGVYGGWTFAERFVDRWGWKPSDSRFMARLHTSEMYECAEPELYSTAALATEFINLQDYRWEHQNLMNTLDTFHLTGGSELYMSVWPELIDCLRGSAKPQTAFHADFTLGGPMRYSEQDLRGLQEHRRNTMYAVNIQGWTPAEFLYVTGRKAFDPGLMLQNLNHLVGWGIPLYITYTGMKSASIDRFEQAAAKHVEGWGDNISRFSIPIHPAPASNVTSSALWGEEFVRGKA